MESPYRPHSALLNEIDVSVFAFNTPIQTTNAIDTADSSVSSSNEPILSVEAIDSTVSDDPVPEDESCSGLAEIQVRATDLFAVNSNILLVPTDIRMFDYIDQDESPEDDPYLITWTLPLTATIPINLTKVLPLNSIIPSQHPLAPYNPDAIRGQFDTGAGISCTQT